ncbi:KGUA [Hepatospora eriocheir]|uniref:KGUA n=1 Tax=Hepatospora eriocheir TaxID=1081669 RepID=A0A1X0Q8S8_9MICR|nr:KGUA [Hepatospora eriocheir]
MILIIAGPSGSGKTTIINELIKRTDYKFVKTFTTREPRNDDCNNYNFISEKEFVNKIHNDELYEYVYQFNNYHGTPKLKKEENLIYNINYDGVRTFYNNKIHNAFYILIKCDRKLLKERISNRNKISQEELNNRLKTIEKYEKLEIEIKFDLIVDNSKCD